jgi:hypothetical protein
MITLNDDQRTFVERYKLPLSSMFDASGMGKKEYHDLMKSLDKLYAVGVTPCKAANHTMRTRNGHCLQCKPETITYLNRYYNNSTVYVAVSVNSRRIKVGYTKNIKERSSAINNTRYAGSDDWQMVYYVNCKHAGKIEAAIQSKLHDYYAPSEYKLGGRSIACYEVFNCGYRKAKEVIANLKKDMPDEFGEEFEAPDIEECFDFEAISTPNCRIKNNDIVSNQSVQSAKTPIRRSEFLAELNHIENPKSLKAEKGIERKDEKINSQVSSNDKKEKTKLGFPALIISIVIILIIFSFKFLS